MTDIIERMGRAALCGWNNVPNDNAAMDAEWERMGPATREAWTRAMRRALEAIREPTEAMLDAPIGETLQSTCRDWLDNYSATQVWRAMIDAALNPDPLNQLGDGATDPLHRSGP